MAQLLWGRKNRLGADVRQGSERPLTTEMEAAQGQRANGSVGEDC